MLSALGNELSYKKPYLYTFMYFLKQLYSFWRLFFKRDLFFTFFIKVFKTIVNEYRYCFSNWFGNIMIIAYKESIVAQTNSYFLQKDGIHHG